MLGLGAHYKPSKPYDFIVPCDVVQKQIVAVEFCKPVRSEKKMKEQFVVWIFDRFLTNDFFFYRKNTEKIQ